MELITSIESIDKSVVWKVNVLLSSPTEGSQEKTRIEKKVSSLCLLILSGVARTLALEQLRLLLREIQSGTIHQEIIQTINLILTSRELSTIDELEIY
jgi:hypothetical protein